MATRQTEMDVIADALQLKQTMYAVEGLRLQETHVPSAHPVSTRTMPLTPLSEYPDVETAKKQVQRDETMATQSMEMDATATVLLWRLDGCALEEAPPLQTLAPNVQLACTRMTPPTLLPE